MISSAKLQAQLIVDGCKRIGVKNVILSPGSRNAPLTIAFDEDNAFEVFVITDERSAAFVALGMAQVSREPVVIACTSGTAALNYYPAIAEAFYQEIPLVVITADRPEEWVDQGDGQTIRQANVFQNMVLQSAEIKEIHTKEQRWLNERTLSEILQKSIEKQKGPVHINVPFSEPLYETTDKMERMNRWTFQAELNSVLSNQSYDELKKMWNQSPKRLIVVGQQHPNNKVQTVLEQLALDGSTAILTEHTSNCYSPYFVSCIDRTLSCISTENGSTFQPDIIVSIGGAIVSKRIKTFLRNSKVPVIRFGESFPFMDTFQNLAFTASISTLEGVRTLFEITKENPQRSNFGFTWNKLAYQSTEKHQELLAKTPWSDLSAMKTIMDVIPDNAHLHLANSSVIRYALLFDPIKSIRYWCNRGASGIDGSTSTAVGASLEAKHDLHVLLTGDLSFFYDSNGLWNSYLPPNLRIILINNGGGDIFNIIPGPSSTNQWKHVFVSEHQQNARAIADQFGLQYYSASSVVELDEVIGDFLVNFSEKTHLLEINTQEIENSEVLNDYFRKFLTNN